MTAIIPTPSEINQLYMLIRARRPGWFAKALDISPGDYEAFKAWIWAEVSYWFTDGQHVVLVHQRNHVVEAHPLFLGRINEGYLNTVLVTLRAYQVRRVEVPLMLPTGRIIRATLGHLGFSLEGTMKDKERLKDPATGAYHFTDVELWAKILT